MSRYDRGLRARQRNSRAREKAQQRKASDLFEQGRERARQAGLPGSRIRVLDAIAEAHHELGEQMADKQVFIGYGAEKAPQRPRPRPSPMPSLAQRTGLHRRTCQRAIADLVAQGIVLRQYGDGGEDAVQTQAVPARRERYELDGHVKYRPVGDVRYERQVLPTGQVKYRPTGADVRYHTYGRGGCDGGGWGLANGYRMPGMPDPPPPAPPPEPDPPPRPGPGRPPAARGWGAQAWEQAERERQHRRGAQPARGP